MTTKMVEALGLKISFFLHRLDLEIRKIVRRIERFHLKIIKKNEYKNIHTHLSVRSRPTPLYPHFNRHSDF